MTDAVMTEGKLRATWGHLLRDPVLWVSLVALLTTVVAYQEGYLSWSQWNAVVLAQAAVAFQWRLREKVGGRRAVPSSERRFWDLLTYSFACWIVAAASYDRLSTAVNVFQDVLIVLFYLLLVAASEKRPDLRRLSIPTDPLRRYDFAAMALFALGLLAYFSMIPGALDPERYDTWIPSAYIYMVLDFFLAWRFWVLAQRSPRRRWRVTYLLLAAGMANWLLTDTLDCISYHPGTWLSTDEPALWHVIWVTPFAFFLIAARLRHLAWGDADASAVLAELDAKPSPTLGPLIFYALAFPFLHLLLHSLGLLQHDLQHSRDVIVLVYLGFAILLGVRHRERTLARHAMLNADRQLLDRKVRHREKMVALGQIAAGVVHEVGNPLNSIAGLTQNLQRKIEDPWAAGKIAQLGVQVDRISAILDQMRDLAQPPRREQGYCSLPELINSTLDLVRFDRRADRVSIRVDIDPSLPAVYGVADQLSQVFWNVALNALDALQNTADPHLEISARFSGQDDARVLVVFEDNGSGISEDLREKIFEPSFSTKTNSIEGRGGVQDDVAGDGGVPGSGMGLGLTVSRRILDEHGGSIRVGSSSGGTSLIVELPVDPVNLQ